MVRAIHLLPVLLIAGCATVPPPPPPPPPPPLELIVPPGTESASDMFGYSQAARVGPWIFVSGQVGFDTEKFGFPEDFDEQVRLAFHNLEMVLKACGASLTDVVSMTTYQLDMNKFNDVVDIRNDVFGTYRPTWTPIGANALALPSVQFTVSVIAYAPNAAAAPASAPGAAVVAPAPAPAAPPVLEPPVDRHRALPPVIGNQRPGY